MSMVAKILIVLNLILAVAVMGAAGAYLQSAEQYKKMYEDKARTAEQVETELKARIAQIQTGLDEANRAKTAALTAQQAAEAANRTLSENNTLNQKKLDDYNATLQGMSAKMADLEGGLKSARDQNEKLLAEKKQAEDDRRAALEAKNNAETEQKRLQTSLDDTTANLDAARKDMVAKAEALEAANTALEMYKAKVGPIGLVAAPVKGRILAADASMDIYLISVGKKDGVGLADELTVYRGDQFVAVVVVDKLFDDKASVVVKRMNGKPLKKSDIKQGDQVATVF